MYLPHTPHFWPIIYLWTMVGLSCRPTHKLLWQRLKGKHLLGRLLPPWGCKKDMGNVSRDKDIETPPKRLKWKERSSWSVFVSVCMVYCKCHVYIHNQLKWTQCANQRCPFDTLDAEDKVFSLQDEARASPVHDVLHFPHTAIPWGRKGQGQGREWH